jgi:hypothetical protein
MSCLPPLPYLEGGVQLGAALGGLLEDVRTLVEVVLALVAGLDDRLDGDAVRGRARGDAHRVADRAATELEHHVLAEVLEQLVHLAGMDAARGDRHHARQRHPILIEVDTRLRVLGDVVQAQRVVVAPDHQRVALELAHDRAGVDVVDAEQADPLGDDAERHAVGLLPRVRAVAGAVKVEDQPVAPRPLRHRLHRRVADGQVHHDDHAAELLGEFGALIHPFHIGGGDVHVVTLDLT